MQISSILKPSYARKLTPEEKIKEVLINEFDIKRMAAAIIVDEKLSPT